MKKLIQKIAALSAAAILLTGCSNQAGGKKEPTFSNLIDPVSQAEVVQTLNAHGVTQSQTDTLINWVNDFNSRISAGSLLDGFNAIGKGADYSGVIVDIKESPDGLIYPEANCRLTSYLLMKNMISTAKTSDPSDTYLVFDLEAIDSYAPFHMTDEERANFVSLFNWIPLHGASTQDEHLALIQQAWKDRDIRINGSGLSLITVYLHSPFDDARFVGHTGVLAETENGLLFVEKYGPQTPFQATKFNNREELKQYLTGRADLYGDETELAPILMENGLPL